MKQKNSVIFNVAIVAITAIVLCVVGLVLFGEDVTFEKAYIGDVWFNTPEAAIAAETEIPGVDTEGVFEIKMLLQTVCIDEYAHLVYVSNADTLVLAICIRNDSNKWAFHGYSEEDISNPNSFLMNGNDNQHILTPYRISKDLSTVYGWKDSKARSIYVNGNQTYIQSYSFTINGTEHSIDYWWIDNLSVDTYSDIQVFYFDTPQ